jgi:hypothetical protein
MTAFWSKKRCIKLLLFGWLVADGWCWFVLREEYCWLIVGGWFIVREKYYWLVADKPREQGCLCPVFFKQERLSQTAPAAAHEPICSRVNASSHGGAGALILNPFLG